MSSQTINREAGDKSKGFTLQKLRATSLMLSRLREAASGLFVAAVEYGGDIYVEDSAKTYVEENKAYGSKDFSFASAEVKNTLVYFLDFWLNNNRKPGMQFGFYTTNSISKEIKAGQIKAMNIQLPDEPILDLLVKKAYETLDLLPAVQKIILAEYKEQYTGNKQYTLKKSHYATIEKFDTNDWTEFLNTIEWKFAQPNIDELEDMLITQIKSVNFPGINIEGKEPFIRAQLFYDLELRQAKKNPAERFITPTDIELIYRRVATGNIEEGSYKYLEFDYTEVRKKTKQTINQFIADKYHTITGHDHPLLVLNRKVALFDPSLKLKNKQTEIQSDSKNHKVEGLFSSFVNAEKPIFLFGELGSGKSTIVGNYILSVTDKDPEIVPLFIPSSYLHEKEFSDIESLSRLFSQYVNQEMMLADKFFDFTLLFKTGKEVLLVVDGVDELETSRSKTLIRLLKRLKEAFSQLRVIATGRPLELEGIIPSGWHTLATIPLTQDETTLLIQQELVAAGLPEGDAKTEAEKKMMFLKNRPELLAVATTPLVICSIANDLDEASRKKSLGDILYDVVQRRLDWHEKDTKELELAAFLKQFPNIYQRETLLADLAFEIFHSRAKALPESKILQILASHVPESPEKNELVNQARVFFTNGFFQKTTDDKYGFISAPLLECAVALKIPELLKTNGEAEKYDFAHWRALSFAMAVCRRKDYTESIRDKIGVILKQQLQWPDKNIAPLAIVLAELRDPKLAHELINGLKAMVFRPIRLMKQKDHLSSYSLAYCLQLAEENGFEWFFNEYLDNKTPLLDYEAEIATDILSYYLILHDFKLEAGKLHRLQNIIKPNISFATPLCHKMLPCLALIAPSTLPQDQRARLLADLLKDDILHPYAEKALTELTALNSDAVLNALETLGQKTWSVENAEVPLLWLKLNNKRPLAKQILDNAITATTKENNKTILSALYAHISKENLFAYLRFSIIGQTKIAGAAALLLYWHDENDFELLSDALVTSIDWLSQQYNMVEEIAAYVARAKEKAVEVLARKMPRDNHLGIPPSYWRIFLDALLTTDKIYVDTFLTAVEDLHAFVLTRYPDIRIRLTRLLTEKPQYKQGLRQAAAGIETGFRNNANSILVTCFPEQEANGLVSLVAGFYKHVSSGEWHSFCFGLNYSSEVLQQLYDSVGKFVEGAKTYAFLLLFHHGYSLSESDLDELVRGLLGPGYFFDRPSLNTDISTPSLLSKPTFLSRLVSFLTDEDKDRAYRAASLLLEYHAASLSASQLAKAWTLYIEEFEDSFFNFVLENEALQANHEFVEHVLNDAKQRGATNILSLFFQAQSNSESWKDLFIRFIKKASKYHADSLYKLHHWLISYTRRNPHAKSAIADALKELLLIPAYKETVDHNSVYLFLELLADEFDMSDKTEIRNLLSGRTPYPDEDLLLALAFRSGYDIPSQYIRASTMAHITLFAPHHQQLIKSIPAEELERLLVDEENVPAELFDKMGQIILYGQLTEHDLDRLKQKNQLAAYFTMVIKYCRKQTVDVSQLFKIREIGGYKNYQQQEKTTHLSIVWKLYRILLRKGEYRELYYAALRQEMDNPNTENFHEYFHELIINNEPVAFHHFQRLLNVFLDRPFYLREDLAAALSDYFANGIPESERTAYKEAIETFLTATINHYEERRVDQYNLILWLFALALLWVTEDVPPAAQTAFLLGLRYVFLERNDMQRALIKPPEIFFRAGELLHYTDSLFSKIDYSRIRQIITAGAQSNIPEIKACCRMLFALSGNRSSH
jgi:type II secretory pathway predicted ATPase ExeA